jgi:hypothetical protein
MTIKGSPETSPFMAGFLSLSLSLSYFFMHTNPEVSANIQNPHLPVPKRLRFSFGR